MEMTVEQIAHLVNGTVRGDGSLVITRVNGMTEAGSGELTFARNAAFVRKLAASRASVALVPRNAEGISMTTIEVDEPDLAFFLVLRQFASDLPKPVPGRHPLSEIAEDAHLGGEVSIGSFCTIASGAALGDRVTLHPGVYIGENCRIGADTVIYPNVVVREGTEIGERCVIHAGACIGSDGFGFAPLGGVWHKIPQIGTVFIGDDVEIGSNTTIDRATFGVTRIGSGTKIDNLVQIGHNVTIGEHCAIAGMAGVAGSATIGKSVRIGANAGVAGHITVGDGSTLGARAGVMRSVDPGAIVSGFPAIDHAKQLRVMAAQQRAPETLRRITTLERQLEALKESLKHETTDNR